MYTLANSTANQDVQSQACGTHMHTHKSRTWFTCAHFHAHNLRTHNAGVTRTQKHVQIQAKYKHVQHTAVRTCALEQLESPAFATAWQGRVCPSLYPQSHPLSIARTEGNRRKHYIRTIIYIDVSISFERTGLCISHTNTYNNFTHTNRTHMQACAPTHTHTHTHHAVATHTQYR